MMNLLRYRMVLWFLFLLLIGGTGCESKLENPADPEAGAYIGFRPWVDSGFPMNATINDTLSFEGIFHGPLDKVEQYDWDFQNDGKTDYTSSTVGVTQWAYEEVGEYQAVLSVRDLAGYTRWDTTDVVITNEDPVPDAGADQSGFLNRAVGLPARGSDDGRILEYRWDYEGNGEFDWVGAKSDTLEIFYPEIGEYMAVLEVVDDDANSARDTVAVSISLGQPVALAGPDTAVSINDIVDFHGAGIDSNGTLMLYEWDFDGDGIIDWTSETTGRTQRVYESLGTWLASLRVTDDDGFTHVDTLEVSVTDLPPELEIRDLGEGWCAEPETLSADIRDDGHVVLYECDFEGDDVFDWTSETNGDAVHQYPKGTYHPALRVTDDDGNVTTETLTFRVGPWTRGAPMQYPRSGVSAEAVDGILYSMSGAAPEVGVYTSVVEAYDPVTKHWGLRQPLVLSQYALATTVLGGRIFGVAGCAKDEDRGAVEEYLHEYDLWKRHSSVRQRRCWPAAAAVDGLLYVFGGQSDGELSSVEVMDPHEGIWRPLTPMPTARHGMDAVALDGLIYVIGGFDGARPLRTMEIYDPATDTWETGPGMPTARTGLATVVWNGKIYAIGGSYMNVVEVYDPATGMWSTATPMPTARYAHGAAVIDDKIYVVGGETLYTFLNVLEIYAPGCD